LISLFSSFTGGRNELHFGVDMGVTTAFSLAVYHFALRLRLPADKVQERLRTGGDDDDQPEPEAA
jgi:hypothetical protein